MDRTAIERTVDHTVREAAQLAVDDPELTRDTELLDEGFVDSLNLVSIVLKLEGVFGIKFSDADMVSGRFTTVSGLTDLIAAKLAA